MASTSDASARLSPSMTHLLRLLRASPLLLVLVPRGASAQSSAAGEGVAHLRPGDVVRITVWENPSMSGEFEIAPDGTLRHPLYNQLKVGGLPVTELRAPIETFLRQYQREPQVEI